MREVALVEARDQLDALVDQVAAGEEFTITRHGKAVARLTLFDGRPSGANELISPSVTNW